MAEIGSAFITIAPSMKGFGGALNAQAGGTIRSTGKSLGATFGKAFLLGGSVLAAAGIGSFLKGSIEEAREAQKVGALTENVIKTTGAAANISAKQVGDLATSLSLKTGIDDEAIQSGSNLLLTFTKVANAGKGQAAIFDRATAAAVDLSASGFGDINGASKQLGKALQDPVKGITALSKSGVTFTEEQKSQIKAMTDSGNVLGAQQIILGEVEHQVKGAAAATSTYGDKAGVAFGNIKEQVGTKLLPVIDGLAKLFLKSVPTITKLIDGIGPAFRKAQALLAPFVDQVRGFFSGGGGDGFVSGVKGVVATLQTNFLPVLKAAANTFKTVVLPAITTLAQYLVTKLTPIFNQVVSLVTTKVIPIIASLAKFFYGTLYPAVFEIVTAIAGSLKPVFDQLFDTFSTKVLPALDRLFAAFQKNQPAIQKVVLVVVKVIGGVLRLAAAILGKVLPILLKFQGFIVSKVIGSLTKLINAVTPVVNAVGRIGKAFTDSIADISSFVTSVRQKVDKVKDFITKLPAKILKAVGNGLALLFGYGKDVVTGLVVGIANNLYLVKKAAGGMVHILKDSLRQGMGINSPSKVTTILGGYIAEGLAVGILSGKKKVTNAIGKVLDRVKEKIDSRISDFISLSSTIGSNFADNLFSAEATDAVKDDAGKVLAPAMSAGQNFLASLTSTKGNLTALLSDFKTLQGFGLGGKFLAQLFSDGGYPLIHELASNKDQATAAGALFGDIQNLSKGLGDAVASNQPDIGGGYTLKDINDALKAVEKAIKKVPDGVSSGVNGAAASGKRKKKTGGKK